MENFKKIVFLTHFCRGIQDTRREYKNTWVRPRADAFFTQTLSCGPTHIQTLHFYVN